MKNKSVIFIEPSGSEANVFDNYMKLPLMGCLYLGTILHNKGYNVRIINENLLNRKISPIELQTDYLCISCLTVNANRGKELARQVKYNYPETKIIFGGIHPSLLSDEFTDISDYVIIGEAEEVIVDVIEGKYSEKIIHGKPVENLDELPLINYSLLENAESMDIFPIMTSRGCPFDCNFCTVTKIFGRLFRKQSVDKILSELRNALNFFKTRYVFIYDDNFTADKKRVNDLMDRIIEEDINIIWTAQVRSDIAKEPQLLKKMHRAGCERVYIGFEAINDDILKSFHKSQTRKDIETAIQIIHNYHICIHGMFIAGEDFDTLENIKQTTDFAIKYDIDTVQFMILTPFPGTQIYKKIDDEKRLLHKNWDYYDGMHVVYKPKNMTPAQLQKSIIKAFRKFYSLERTIVEILYLSFTIFYDALVWNVKRAFRYDLNNLFLRVGAKFIIKEYLTINKFYIEYLEKLSEEKK